MLWDLLGKFQREKLGAPMLLKCPLCQGTEFESGHMAARNLLFIPRGSNPQMTMLTKAFQKSWVHAEVCKQCKHVMLFLDEETRK
jgi:hypothetical protein